MKHDTHFRPLEREHSLFSLIVEGKRNILVDMSKLIDVIGDDAAEESAEDLAQELWEADVKANRTTYIQFIEIHKPKLIDGQWWITKSLTEQGQKVYDALETGIFWDNRTNAKDFKSSIAYYEDMMERGSIDMRFVDLIVNNQDPEFKSLKSKLVYFKMQGQKQDHRITNL